MTEPLYLIAYSDGTTDVPLPWHRVIARLRAFKDLRRLHRSYALRPVRVERVR